MVIHKTAPEQTLPGNRASFANILMGVHPFRERCGLRVTTVPIRHRKRLALNEIRGIAVDHIRP